MVSLLNVNEILFYRDDNAHADNEHFSMEKVVDNMKLITDAMKDLDIDVYPVLGNHDVHPKSQFPAEAKSTIYSEAALMWESWLGQEAAEEFRNNGKRLGVVSKLK